MKSFAGSLGSQMAGLGGENNPAPDPFQMMQGAFGGGGEEDNPGMKMFKGQGGKDSPSFLGKVAGNLSDQLFQRAMMGFMGR